MADHGVIQAFIDFGQSLAIGGLLAAPIARRIADQGRRRRMHAVHVFRCQSVERALRQAAEDNPARAGFLLADAARWAGIASRADTEPASNVRSPFMERLRCVGLAPHALNRKDILEIEQQVAGYLARLPTEPVSQLDYRKGKRRGGDRLDGGEPGLEVGDVASPVVGHEAQADLSPTPGGVR